MLGAKGIERRFEKTIGLDILRRFEKVVNVFMLLVTLILFGMAGYVYLEGLSPFDAIYLTIITVATVGYGDIVPMSFGGKVFSLFVVVFGGVVLAYGLSVLVSFLVEVEIKEVLGVYRMKKEIMGKKGHIIVCGYGTIGRNVVARLENQGTDFVVVENDPEKIEELAGKSYLVIRGDATVEETLKQANIGEALGLISALSTDPDNLIVSMTARDLNPDITIVSRVTRRTNIKRFIGVGVERVVLPEFVGGTKLADAILKPRVTEFLGGTGLKESLIEMDDMPVEEASPYSGKTIKDLRIPQAYRAILAAIERNGELIIPPLAEDVIKGGDILFTVGKKEDLARLREAIRPR
jgi:voltage-gated potassium channel